MIPKEVLERARKITKNFGRGFYRASFLFPKKVREATWIFYAFVRLPDEMVDSQSDLAKAKKDLEKYINDWHSVLEGKKESTHDPILFATKEVFEKYNIPYDYSHSFLKAMDQDLTKSRYYTYQELEEYMYGTASVVGLAMSYIIGFKDGALTHAKALGEAFQLINFLRDSKDDFDSRGRIYLPKEDMERFGVTEDHIKNSILDQAWRDLMAFEVRRAKDLLENGKQGITMLRGRGRSAVYASYLIYKKLLEEIEKENYNTFSKRIVISPLQKTMLLLKSIWTKNLQS
jgi:phytoene synthase